MKKRGISSIIATVLLIVLTLVAVSILSVFLIPFVKDSLEGSKSCVGVLGKIRFEDGSGYNCRHVNDSVARTGFSVTILSDDIVGFKATLFTSGSSDTYEIINGSSLANIRQLGRDFNTAMETPEQGGTRTYSANGNFQRVEINPILVDGTVCEVQERITIDTCMNQEVKDNLHEY